MKRRVTVSGEEREVELPEGATAGELVAVGRLEIAPAEIALGGQGLAVKVREAV